jgi:hypothetical protein
MNSAENGLYLSLRHCLTVSLYFFILAFCTALPKNYQCLFYIYHNEHFGIRARSLSRHNHATSEGLARSSLQLYYPFSFIRSLFEFKTRERKFVCAACDGI